MGAVFWLSRAFLTRWVGEDLNLASEVTLILGIPFALASMMYPANNILFSKGRTRWMAMLICGGGILSVILSVVLGLRAGLRGVVAGSAIAMLLERGIVLPWLLGRCISIRPIPYMLFHIFRPALISVIPCGLFALLTTQWLMPDYSRIFLLSLGYSTIFLMTAPWLVLDRPTRCLIWKAMPWVKPPQ